jgi:hypothetical protein
MLTRRPVVRSVILELSLLALPCALFAQPSIEVYAGTVSADRPSSRPDVRLFGGVVDVVAMFDDGMFEAMSCRPCAAGSSVRVGARITAEGKGDRHYSAHFTFEGTSAVEIPPDGSAELTLMAPFTFHGRVGVANARNPDSEGVEPHVELHGAGVASVRLSSILDGVTGQRLYFFQNITYQFSGPR